MAILDAGVIAPVVEPPAAVVAPAAPVILPLDVAIGALQSILVEGGYKYDERGRPIGYHPDPELMVQIARDALLEIDV